MFNQHTANKRNYPLPPKSKQANNVIHLPVIAASKSEDEWENIEAPITTFHKKNKSSLINPYDPYDASEDENDWGGLAVDITKGQTIVSDDNYKQFVSNNEFSNFTWLIPNVLAGGSHPALSPSGGNTDYLKKAGIEAILSISMAPLDKEHINGMRYCFIKANQGETFNLREAVYFIDRAEQDNLPVFVHSFTGRGRASLALTAYMVFKNYLNADDAIPYMRQNYHPNSIETKEQETDFYRYAVSL